MTGATELRAAVTGLIGLAAAEEEMLLASAPDGEDGSPDRWAATPLVAHNAEFRQQQVVRLNAVLRGGTPPDFAETDHRSPDAYRRYCAGTKAEVTAVSRQSAGELIDGLAAVPDEDLSDASRHPWLRGRQLWLQVVVRGFWHPIGHLGDYQIACGRAARAVAMQSHALATSRYLGVPDPALGMAAYSLACAQVATNDPTGAAATLIFQDGHLQGPLGFTSFGGIIPWVPLFMFVFLFGLSMDYHVFILSRIRELRAGGRSHEEAVVGGVAACSGVVTSAAVIMVAVFSIFATLSLIELKMIGVGLASAVLIDATIVRGILVPAALALLGEHSWYFPRWLEWLPGWRLEASGAAVAPLPASVPAVSVQAGTPSVPAAPGVAPPAGREPEVVLAGERTGSREGAA